MLYWLYEFAAINLLQYITVRAGISFFIAFVSTVFILPRFIVWAKRRNANQPIYSLAPQTHQKKSKTPTMGGVIFLATSILSILLCTKLSNFFVLASLLCIAGFGAIGIKDDLAKILGGENQAGLSPKIKLLLQFGVAFLVALLTVQTTGISTDVYVPFINTPSLTWDFSFFSFGFWSWSPHPMQSTLPTDLMA